MNRSRMTRSRLCTLLQTRPIWGTCLQREDHLLDKFPRNTAKRDTRRSISGQGQRTSKDLFRRYLARLDKKASFVMPETASPQQLVWIDCEMTGLDIENDTILSVACFITTADLILVEDKGYLAVVHHEQEMLDRMDDWCTRQHGSSGLITEVVASNTTAEQAANGLLAYIKKYVKSPQEALLAGNTVHVDKAFLRKPPYRPIIDYLHYRILDVSSLKEAARRWSPHEVLMNIPRKQGQHEARADILDSIEEARYYRKAIFQRLD